MTCRVCWTCRQQQLVVICCGSHDESLCRTSAFLSVDSSTRHLFTSDVDLWPASECCRKRVALSKKWGSRPGTQRVACIKQNRVNFLHVFASFQNCNTHKIQRNIG